MRKINKIFIHCSDSVYGDVVTIDAWHRENTYTDSMGVVRNWSGIGYHYVILNGSTSFGDAYREDLDGNIEIGREEEKAGAHVRGENHDSLGICLIGGSTFTHKQLFFSLPNLLKELMEKHEITVKNVLGHYEFDPNKTCPHINMIHYRNFLEDFCKGKTFLEKTFISR